jgi:Reverse transcriptase (RNA-dependent DNA polymerase)/gag-polypeptide of LTR copia-type
LEVIRRQLKNMGNVITEEDMMIHIINNLPQEYDAITDQLEVELDSKKGYQLSVPKIKERLRNKFNKMKKRIGKEPNKDHDYDEEKEERALTMKAKFKGQCTHFGKWGHKSSDCRDKKKNEEANFVQNEKGHSTQNTDESRKFIGECFYCHKMGHRMADCRKKKFDEKKGKERAHVSDERSQLRESEYVLASEEVSIISEHKATSQNWIGDSGASSHMIYSLDGVTSIGYINVDVKLGDGSIVKATKQGILKGKVQQIDGTSTIVQFEVKYVPDLWCNLLSITTSIKNGSSLTNEESILVLTKNEKKIKFEQGSQSGDGSTMSVKIIPIVNSSKIELLTAATNLNQKQIDINDMHRLLGHFAESKIRSNSKFNSIEINQQEGQAKSTRLERELRKLNTYYNQTIPTEQEEFAEVAFVGATNSDYNEPTNFKEAWYHEDTNLRTKWREAVKKELFDMMSKGVWRECTLPKERKLIGNKWVFKLKKNGTHRARLVALGYSQVPGVDYTENYAFVINDISVRIILIMYLLNKYDSKIIDVETAFLYGDLDEEIYMKIPDGLQEYKKISPDKCLKLCRSLYGLVQAARQWWKKFATFRSQDLGFTRS